MQDPRTEIQEMITEMRESLKEMEMKLWEVPHHDETDEYDEPYAPGAVIPDADDVMPAMVDDIDYDDFNDDETTITASNIKDQLEAQGREIGIELDKRHNIDTLMAQLAEAVPAAPLPEAMDDDIDELDEFEDSLDDEIEHTHEDGTTHSHEGGDEHHHHHDDGTMHDHEGGDEPHTHDDGLPSDVEPPIPADTLMEEETGEDSTKI